MCGYRYEVFIFVAKCSAAMLRREMFSVINHLSSYYKRVVFIDRSPAVCYTVWDAVDW